MDYVADRLDLRPDIRLATTVERCDFDAAANLWRVTLRGECGGEKRALAKLMVGCDEA